MPLSVGSTLIGLAAAWLVIAFVIQPFRRKEMTSDRVIEAWIADTLNDTMPPSSIEPAPPDESYRYCPYCGRPLENDHQFCPWCGKGLSADSENG